MASGDNLSNIRPLQELNPARFETPQILKTLNLASRQLAELKGVVASIPQEAILVNTLGIQEAKDSSEIENIVTTHDELYTEDLFPEFVRNVAAKEVYRYRQALQAGFELSRTDGLLTINHMVKIQSELLDSAQGIRTLPGTNLQDSGGNIVYTPPQDYAEVMKGLTDLEKFINLPEQFDADPIIKMALIHHQFETIHPFYDGNGRTGRILNVLYLVKEGLLNIPVLYLSRPLLRSKGEYYRLLQAVRDQDAWEDWVLYMLNAVQESTTQAIASTEAIKRALLTTKHEIRSQFKFYSQDLINNLFSHPYTKIEFVERDLRVSRLTATRYLDQLSQAGYLSKQKIGKSNYYMNIRLIKILTGDLTHDGAQ